MDIRDIIKDGDKYLDKEITFSGWIRHNRDSKSFGFLEISDGTDINKLQVVYEEKTKNFEKIKKYNQGSSVEVKGVLVESPKEEQKYEVKASEVILIGEVDADYPLQPKRHTMEFFREIAYLRPRANLFQAVFRVRNVAAFSIHNYFQERNFIYANTPIITANDGEGAGEMFRVTTRDDNDHQKDFFGKKVGLTVTGQLEGEAMAMAFKKIYTFGPTFRAENSNTKHHAAEFWMVEPEVAFLKLDGLMDLEEDMLKHVVKDVLDKCKDELEFLDKFKSPGLIKKLEDLVNSKMERITYEKALEILKESGKNFAVTPEYGVDIGTEYEKYLTEEYFRAPVFITDWPKEMKAFYMKLNKDDKTVAAVDLIVPLAGELMGGSERESDYDKLLNRMKELKMKTSGLEWYLDLRRFGTCPHSGFGLGFERLIIYLTGVENIRDVIPFPRTVGNCEF